MMMRKGKCNPVNLQPIRNKVLPSLEVVGSTQVVSVVADQSLCPFKI